MEQSNSALNMASTSDVNRHRKIFSLYNTIEDFTFSMPGGWDDYTISVFVEACHKYVEDLRNYRGDFMRQWSRIVDYGIAVTNNINCFNITVTMELAKVLKSYLLKNCIIEEYMANRSFRELFYATEDLLEYFPNPSQKSPLQNKKCDCAPKVKQNQNKTTTSKQESVSDIIKAVSKQYHHLFGAKGIPSSILWSEMTQKVSEKTGLKVDVKQFLESVKINITKDIMKEPSKEGRGIKFLSVAKDYLPIFDYIPPRSIKKKEFLTPQLIGSNISNIRKLKIRKAVRLPSLNDPSTSNSCTIDSCIVEDIGACLEVPYEEIETIVIDSDSDDNESSLTTENANKDNELDDFQEVDAITSVVGSCNETKAVVVERIERDPVAMLRPFRDTDHSYEMIMPSSDNLQNNEFDDYLNNDVTNHSPQNEDIYLTENVPNKSQPLKDLYADNFEIDKQTLDIYLDGTSDSDIQNSLKTLTPSLNTSIIDENKTTSDFSATDAVDITLGGLDQEIFPLQYTNNPIKQVTNNDQNTLKETFPKELNNSPISISSGSSGSDSIPESLKNLYTRSLETSPLRLASPIAKFLIEDIQHADTDDDFNFFPSPVKESCDLYRKNSKQPIKEDTSNCPELNSFDRIDSVLRELEECEKIEKAKSEQKKLQPVSSYIQPLTSKNNDDTFPEDNTSSKVLNINTDSSSNDKQELNSDANTIKETEMNNLETNINSEPILKDTSAEEPCNLEDIESKKQCETELINVNSFIDEKENDKSDNDIDNLIEEQTTTLNYPVTVKLTNESVEKSNEEINISDSDTFENNENTSNIEQNLVTNDENQFEIIEEETIDSNIDENQIESEIHTIELSSTPLSNITTALSSTAPANITFTLSSTPLADKANKLRTNLFRRKSKSEDNIVYKIKYFESLNEDIDENLLEMSKLNASTNILNDNFEMIENNESTIDVLSIYSGEEQVVTEENEIDYYSDSESTCLYSDSSNNLNTNNNILLSNDHSNLDIYRENQHTSHNDFSKTQNLINNYIEKNFTISGFDVKRIYSTSILNISDKLCKRTLFTEKLLNNRRFNEIFEKEKAKLCQICDSDKNESNTSNNEDNNNLKRANLETSNIENDRPLIKRRKILNYHAHEDENLECPLFHGFEACCQELSVCKLEFIKNEGKNNIDFNRSDNVGLYIEDGEEYMLKKVEIIVEDFVKDAVKRLLKNDKERGNHVSTNTSNCNCDKSLIDDVCSSNSILLKSEVNYLNSLELSEEITPQFNENQLNDESIKENNLPSKNIDFIKFVDYFKDYIEFEERASKYSIINCDVNQLKKKNSKIIIKSIKDYYDSSFWCSKYTVNTDDYERQIVPYLPDNEIDDKQNEILFAKTIDIYISDDDYDHLSKGIKNISKHSRKNRMKTKHKRILNDSSNFKRKKNNKKLNSSKKLLKKSFKRKHDDKCTIENINNFFDYIFEESSTSKTLKDLLDNEGEYDFGFDLEPARRRRKLPAWYNKFRDEYRKHIEWKEQLRWKMESEIIEIERNKLLILEKVNKLLKSKANDL